MSRLVPDSFDLALAAAVRAPSPHNAQPWRFVVDDEHVSLWLDRDRVLNVADPDAEEARLSCGAALLNLCLTLRAHRMLPAVRLLPDKADPDQLARIRIEGNWTPSPQERQLAEAISLRHTNRRPFRDEPVAPRDRSILAAAARAEDGQLEFLDASARYDDVATLVRRAEFLQENDADFRDETRWWMHRELTSPDGIPTAAQGPPPEFSGAVSLRESHTNPALPPRVYEQQPLLAAVLTRGRGTRADVQAGMVMQRVLLAATSVGLATSFLSQPFETPPTRADLNRLFHHSGSIHALLRIGHGQGPAAVTTARRSMSAVVTDRRRKRADNDRDGRTVG